MLGHSAVSEAPISSSGSTVQATVSLVGQPARDRLLPPNRRRASTASPVLVQVTLLPAQPLPRRLFPQLRRRQLSTTVSVTIIPVPSQPARGRLTLIPRRRPITVTVVAANRVLTIQPAARRRRWWPPRPKARTAAPIDVTAAPITVVVTAGSMNPSSVAVQVIEPTTATAATITAPPNGTATMTGG